jgi:hypothetical protein
MRRVAVLVCAGLLLAGCADTEPSVYKPGGTAACLRKAGYRVTTDPARLGLVERSAENGGLVAFEPGNAVRIAFGGNSDDAIGIEAGFRRFVSKKLRPHILDVMRTQKNAVLLWTVTPPVEELNKVYGCLKG